MLLTQRQPDHRPRKPALSCRLRARRGWVAVMLVAYLLTGALVPPGHMAAPLASGTAFHLCPGDLHSAWILQSLAANAAASAEPTPSAHDTHHQRHHAVHHQSHHAGHHQSHHVPSDDTGSDVTAKASVVSKSAADSGCVFAGGVAGVATASLDVTAAAWVHTTPGSPVGSRVRYRRDWLRPPPRSPPV